MQPLPHHDGSPLYVSTDAPELGDSVRLRLRVPLGFGEVDRVFVRSNPDREPRFDAAGVVDSGGDGWQWWEASVVVGNPTHRYRWLLALADGTALWLSAAGLSDIEPRDSDDFALVAHPPPPSWGRSTVMYQVFPDRFARSADAVGRELPAWAEPADWGDEPLGAGPSTPRQFFGGDLPGIEEHLDHLERLGVTSLYLTPFFAAHSNHRYDALSFDQVDPLLGGDDALISLVVAAHSRGLTVIGDLTTNHSGDAHEWFTSSHLTPGAPESDFYFWLDDEQRSYEAWYGVPSLPKFDWRSPELRRRFIEGAGSVVARWLSPPFNLDGWRIDVANMTGRLGAVDLNAEVRQILRRTMLEVNPDTLLLAEYTNDAAPDFDGDAWHGAMSYASFTRPVWSWLSQPGPTPWFFGQPLSAVPTYSGHQFVAALTAFSAAFPWRVRLHNMNALDTHDTARFATNALPGVIPVAVGLSMTLPGIPVIFAGDEFGLVGANGEASRSPIPWDAAPASDRIDLYSSLIALRRSSEALNYGGLRWLHIGDDAVAFVREHPAGSVLVVAARAASDFTLPPGTIGPVGSLLTDPELTGTVDVAGLRFTATAPAFAAWSVAAPPAPPF